MRFGCVRWNLGLLYVDVRSPRGEVRGSRLGVLVSGGLEVQCWRRELLWVVLV